MRKNELISVIVPVYNTQNYLVRCMNSLLAQTYTNIEIILVDDGSTDSSPLICDEFEKKYDQIKVIHKVNGGLSSARNAGLEVCRGEYISFVDSDDYVSKDFLETLYEQLSAYNADMCKIDYLEVFDDTAPRPSHKKCMATFFSGHHEIEKSFFTLNVDSVCVFLYRRELIEKQRFLLGYTSEDIWFNFNTFKDASSFVYLPAKKYFYFHNSNSISNGPFRKPMLNAPRFRKRIFEYFKNNSQDTEIVQLSEASYARAIMGAAARMTLFGADKSIDETAYLECFKKEFKKHKGSYFKSKYIPLSRKVLAILVFYCNPIIRNAGRRITHANIG